MAKTSGPLLSLGATGTIAGALTFSKWKGVGYARQRVIPANPQTTEQTLTRDVFRNASNIWKGAGALLTAPWDRFAVGQPLTGRNAFMKEFVARLRSEVLLTNMLFAPSAKGGTPLDSIIATGGALEIVVDSTPPTPPTGWTLQAVVAAAIADQDPGTMTDYAVVVDENLVDPYQITLTGLAAATSYVVAAWPRWVKPDGSIAYGQSISTTESTT